MRHPTTQVETDNINVQRERLKRDLQSLIVVESARDDLGTPHGVVFTVSDNNGVRGVSSDVLNVLAKHGAMLPDNQPQHNETYSALIE